MSTVYISHIVSPWELAQVYVLARETERQGLQSFIPDRTWVPANGVPPSLTGVVAQAELILLFATLSGNHLEWVNQELAAAQGKPVVAVAERGIKLTGIDGRNIVEFDRSEDMADALGLASARVGALRLQQRNKNLVTGLLVGGLVLLLLRGLQEDGGEQ